FSTLTAKQVGDIAKEHVLDWLIGNDDTKSDNILVTSNGSLVGIDKGRTFVNLGGWDGMSGTQSMDTRSQTIYYDLFQAMKSGKIDKDTADQAYRAMQRRVAQI